MRKGKNVKKVIILGIDGMDPGITEQLMEQGKLVNLAQLKAQGSYARLGTTIPSETAVVWSSFATGLNPGGHGIFDFVMRDPENYQLYLSLNEISDSGGAVKVQMRRKGQTFWKTLSDNKIPSFIYFCPNTFPPEKVYGKMLSGLGVPDISGTMGKFSFYTTRPLTREDRQSRGRVINVNLENGVIRTNLYGPRVVSAGSQAESAAGLKINIQPGKDAIVIELDGKKIMLKENNWSSWQRVSFKLGAFKKAEGIVKFYLKSVHPDFQLYAGPINFNPEKPLFPVSYPPGYSKELSLKNGFYYTQGMPYDTWALTEDRLSEKEFLEQVDMVLSEQTRILRQSLKEFKGGFFFFYFETLDVIQHMFWRYRDQAHPLYQTALQSQYSDTIFRYYEEFDRIIGEVLREQGKDAVLMVLSDHGFSNFRRAIHLNRWLLENGYLVLHEGCTRSEDFFNGVDWSRTKAYALGFGGIYLNRRGREHLGIVNDPDAGKLKEEIISRLKQFRDEKNGEDIVKEVYDAEKVYRGLYVSDAPDLYVGFNPGYRASWQTALGGTPETLIEDNKKKWSGDHLFDRDCVPGVIFINRKTDLVRASILDIAPSVLDIFGIKKSGLEGETWNNRPEH